LPLFDNQGRILLSIVAQVQVVFCVHADLIQAFFDGWLFISWSFIRADDYGATDRGRRVEAKF